MIEQITKQYEDELFLKAEGFDDAVIGVDETEMRLIYSVKKCLEILQADMTKEEALEYLEYNIANYHVGKKTPIWCFDNFDN